MKPWQIALCCAVCAWVPAAYGQPSETEKETARNLMRQGDARFEAREYAKALSFYRAAHEIMGVPTTGLAVARAQERVGKWVEARASALDVVSAPLRSDEPPAFTAARRDARSLAGELADRIPRLTVRIRSAPPNVRVTIDGIGISAAEAAKGRDLNPGLHRVTAAAPRFRDAVREVRLAAREHRALDLVLVRSDSPKVEPEEGSSAGRAVAYVLMALGSAGLTVGAVTGIVSLRETSSLKERCTASACPPEVSEDLDRARTLATVSDVSFVAGGVAAAAGIVLFLTVGLSPSTVTGGTSGLRF